CACDLRVFVAALPPSATLFPYTTLFRSRRGQHLPAGRCVCGLIPHHFCFYPRGRLFSVFASYGAEGTASDATPRSSLFGPRARGDRKSTRLNSSHVKISYAVFCPKTKTV